MATGDESNGAGGAFGWVSAAASCCDRCYGLGSPSPTSRTRTNAAIPLCAARSAVGHRIASRGRVSVAPFNNDGSRRSLATARRGDCRRDGRMFGVAIDQKGSAASIGCICAVRGRRCKGSMVLDAWQCVWAALEHHQDDDGNGWRGREAGEGG